MCLHPPCSDKSLTSFSFFFEKINFSDYEVILLKLFKLSCGFGATDGKIDIFGKN